MGHMKHLYKNCLAHLRLCEEHGSVNRKGELFLTQGASVKSSRNGNPLPPGLQGHGAPCMEMAALCSLDGGVSPLRLSAMSSSGWVDRGDRAENPGMNREG